MSGENGSVWGRFRPWGARGRGHQYRNSKKRIVWKKLKTTSIRVPPPYGATHISENFPVPPASEAAAGGSLSGCPSSASTRASILEVAALASSSLPCWANQRGDSGILRRINQTAIAPSEPRKTTHRHPETPTSARGTKIQDTNATNGMAKNWTD